ncbi:major histocompatibility complex class I-related gene protein-like isoform X2 [Megalobrama amblycephala]|uniref:major histocompatibility complex class I-related gene protein-like isoform X2 n=1 Tax=Megalobrama amblycephala TaxID=75352 RepID=UPI0020143391|nr:major histocompatibility complex class I-related gene protein-like isoform X2 [Megalobrama amblycephala]
MRDRRNAGHMDRILVLLVLLPPTFASYGSGHSLWLFSTYIQGETQFPEFSYATTLDDITVGYYNSETYIPRGNTTNEDDVVNSDYIKGISDYMYGSFLRRSKLLRKDSQNDSLDVYQTLVVCELLDLNNTGKMLTKDAARGCTTDELCYFNNTFTYKVIINISQDKLKPHLEEFKLKYKKFYQPVCIRTLKKYLEKRQNEVNRKAPNIRFFQKANSDSGGFRVSCLATGFYPRHINLTLFRDGQPVSDHEITGGDLLPNGDGTYQMRKSLEISADKHKYTCSATHLSLDNKLDVELEFDPGVPFKSVILPVLIVLALMLVFGAGVVLYKYRRRRAGRTRTEMNVPSSNCDYSAASNADNGLPSEDINPFS